MLVDPSQTSQQRALVALGQLETLHEFADGYELLSFKTGWLVLEVGHHKFEGIPDFILSWGTWSIYRADG